MSVTELHSTRLAGSGELNIEKTFECGQCFRWNRSERGGYLGVASGRLLHIWESGGNVLCSAAPEELSFWEYYFDLSADYASATARFTSPEYLKTCAAFGAGIRILRQEPWEALCSFIISQCNNIPRIKQIVETLCRLFGTELGEGLFSFPTADVVASLTLEQLSPLRSGYRAQYILNAARAVSEGTLDINALHGLSPERILYKVTRIHGVGEKVANCFMLYGLHIMDRFPIDVWMKRALAEHFPPDFDPGSLGEFAGLAQQYIFYYARSAENKGKALQNC